MTREQKIIRGKVGLLELAKQLGSVSGISPLTLPAWDESDKGGNLNSVLIVLPRSIRVPARPHFIRRPTRDTLPPGGGSSCCLWPFGVLQSLSPSPPQVPSSSGTLCRRSTYDA